MKNAGMMFYLDESGISNLLEQVEGSIPVETSGTTASEDSRQSVAGIEAGGGFFALLNLAKASFGTTKAKKKGTTDGQKFSVGPFGHFDLAVNALKTKARGRFFDSLDTAFESAPQPDDGCSWICVRDKFSLTNVGTNLSFDVLNKEQRFVFEIDPSRHPHSDRDDYFKSPKRLWHLTMSASFERCPRLKGHSFGHTSHEARYFSMYNYTDVPLRVFGCYLRNGFKVVIIPYAIWV